MIIIKLICKKINDGFTLGMELNLTGKGVRLLLSLLLLTQPGSIYSHSDMPRDSVARLIAQAHE